MIEETTVPGDRPMRLRYNGRCRLCGAPLSAGTSAIYEASTRTVRCLECVPVTAAPALAESAPDAAPDDRTGDSLRLRAPASAVIAEALRLQAAVPPRSAAARLFGRTPLSEESRPWYLGALGELQVALTLDGLAPEWSVIHAIPIGTAGSDIDHLVIGPGGVFTINSKNHSGAKVWVGSRRLLVNGRPTDHLRNSEHEARRVTGILTRAAKKNVSVGAIIAIVGADRITMKERPVSVEVLRSTQLVPWLQHRPAVLAGDELADLQRVAHDLATWGIPRLVEADLDGFAALRVTVEQARRRRIGWGLALFLTPLALSVISWITIIH